MSLKSKKVKILKFLISLMYIHKSLTVKLNNPLVFLYTNAIFVDYFTKNYFQKVKKKINNFSYSY
jgi:hypothetical protein